MYLHIHIPGNVWTDHPPPIDPLHVGAGGEVRHDALGAAPARRLVQPLTRVLGVQLSVRVCVVHGIVIGRWYLCRAQ